MCVCNVCKHWHYTFNINRKFIKCVLSTYNSSNQGWSYHSGDFISEVNFGICYNDNWFVWYLQKHCISVWNRFWYYLHWVYLNSTFLQKKLIKNGFRLYYIHDREDNSLNLDHHEGRWSLLSSLSKKCVHWFHHTSNAVTNVLLTPDCKLPTVLLNQMAQMLITDTVAFKAYHQYMQ